MPDLSSSLSKKNDLTPTNAAIIPAKNTRIVVAMFLGKNAKNIFIVRISPSKNCDIFATMNIETKNQQKAKIPNITTSLTSALNLKFNLITYLYSAII